MRSAMVVLFSLMLSCQSYGKEIPQYELWYSRSMISISIHTGKKAVIPPPAPLPQPVNECLCEGTGKSGDGLGPCACPDGCKGCKKIKAELAVVIPKPEVQTKPLPEIPPLVKQTIQEAVIQTLKQYNPLPITPIKETKSPLEELIEKGRADRIIYFTQSGCGACEVFQKKFFEPLKEKGWLIGPESSNHIQIINISLDEELGELFKVKSTPSLQLIKDHKVKGELIEGQTIKSPFDFSKLLEEKPISTTQERLSLDELRAFAKAYRGPDSYTTTGTYKAHLRDPNHDFSTSQVNGLTEWECYKLHGASHNGYLTPFQILIEPTTITSRQSFISVPSKTLPRNATRYYQMDCQTGNCKWRLFSR